jgi:hypothetical protein
MKEISYRQRLNVIKECHHYGCEDPVLQQLFDAANGTEEEWDAALVKYNAKGRWYRVHLHYVDRGPVVDVVVKVRSRDAHDAAIDACNHMGLDIKKFKVVDACILEGAHGQRPALQNPEEALLNKET